MIYIRHSRFKNVNHWYVDSNTIYIQEYYQNITRTKVTKHAQIVYLFQTPPIDNIMCNQTEPQRNSNIKNNQKT